MQCGNFIQRVPARRRGSGVPYTRIKLIAFVNAKGLPGWEARIPELLAPETVECTGELSASVELEWEYYDDVSIKVNVTCSECKQHNYPLEAYLKDQRLDAVVTQHIRQMPRAVVEAFHAEHWPMAQKPKL
jgi:hypothetical protein